jgi:hypothetical protein
MMRSSTSALSWLAFVALMAPAMASAQTLTSEARSGAEPLYMLNEPARIVDVVDSFDAGSSFSFRLTAGYTFQRRTASIERELRTSNLMTGGGTVQFGHVADYTETTHTLLLNAEVGLFHDLSLSFGLPFILSNSRGLTAASDPNAAVGLQDGWTHNGMPTNLFSAPFNAPERSGIDQLRVGFSWAIFNQQRDRALPTWLVHFEWRPPVGDRMRPCNQSPAAGVAACPDESSVPSIPGSGINSTGATTRGGGSGLQGVSRGLHGVYFTTVIARRFGYLEPYAGLDFLAEFPLRDSPFRYFNTPYGLLSNFPPIQGSLVVGTEIVPWENRETWQRVVLDLRVRGTYRSQGRDYSPLYDALGSSTSRPINQPGCPSNVRSDDGSCQPGREVYFDGTTTVASHMIFNGQFNLSVQPAKFLRFNLGAGFSWVTPHLITATDACNPNETIPETHPEWRGGCVSDSAPDPTHRAVIDGVGGRFRTSGELLIDVFASVALTPRFF